MKINLRSAGFITFLLLGTVVSNVSKGVDGAPAPCAVIVKNSHGTQIIPPNGKVQVKLKLDQSVSCGAMIITHHEGIWIRHSNQSIMKIAPDTFFELGKAKGEPNRVFRGEVLISAPPSSVVEEFVTVNGKIRFTGGVAWLRYSADDKETTAASFNRTLVFMNKFNDRAIQEIRVGEISRLKLGDPRVVPTQPEVMESVSVKEVVAEFGLTTAEQDEMTALVERVYESRTKALVADIEDWRKMEEEQTKKEAVRTAAALQKNAKRAVEDAEAEATMALFKRKIFGQEDHELLSEDRKPAGVSEETLKDPAYEQARKKKAVETKKIADEVSRLKTE